MKIQLGRVLFALTVIALGILDLVYRDTLMWKVLPKSLPASTTTVLALTTGALLIAAGAGLLVPKFQLVASRVLLVFLFVWDVLIGIPPVIESPGTEVRWLILGMMTIVLMAGWLLAGKGQVAAARTIVGLALLPVGLSHFSYQQVTLDLVPLWMPARLVVVYVVGAAHAAAGVGLLFGVVPRLAARMEAGMLLAFAVLVWIPRVISTPATHFNWTELLGTVMIGAAMWVVADSWKP
ncbi:MAG TPA: hypothetical protein VJS20_01255 [Gemmatimonadales bacterium]|nr:hypothetical protein [Gemmatimonadales bacterium]